VSRFSEEIKDAEIAALEEQVGQHVLYYSELEKTNADLQARVDALEALITGLECDADWCGKSPHGTPGKRGYDDGKCQICKALAATEQETE